MIHPKSYIDSSTEAEIEYRNAKRELRILELELQDHRPKYLIREEIARQKKYIKTLD